MIGVGPRVIEILGVWKLNDRLAKQKIFLRPLIFSVVIILSLVLFDGKSSANNNGPDDFIGITGLVINETVSKAGHDLFDAFTSRWEPIEGLDFTITIVEKPDLVFGTQFYIKVDDNVVYGGRLNPRWDAIEKTAKTSIQRVSLYLLERLTVSKELEMY